MSTTTTGQQSSTCWSLTVLRRRRSTATRRHLLFTWSALFHRGLFLVCVFSFYTRRTSWPQYEAPCRHRRIWWWPLPLIIFECCQMLTNCLKLNAEDWASKYASAALGSSGPSLCLGDETVTPSDHVRVLGVTFLSNLSLDKHVSSVTAECFYSLHQLRRVWQSLAISNLFDSKLSAVFTLTIAWTAAVNS